MEDKQDTATPAKKSNVLGIILTIAIVAVIAFFGFAAIMARIIAGGIVR